MWEVAALVLPLDDGVGWPPGGTRSRKWPHALPTSAALGMAGASVVGESLFQRFESALKTKGVAFDGFEVDADWKQILAEYGFSDAVEVG